MRILQIAAVIVAMGALSGCTDEDGAFHTLAVAGYTGITITGSVWFSGCGVGEAYQTGFVAFSPAKAVVSGVVCKRAWPFDSSLIRTFG